MTTREQEEAALVDDYEAASAALKACILLLQPLRHVQRVRVITAAAIMLEVEPEVSARLVPERQR